MRSQKKRAGEKMENLLLRCALVPSAALYLISQFMCVHVTPKHVCSKVENSSPARSDSVCYQTFTRVHRMCAFQSGGSKTHRIRSSANIPLFLHPQTPTETMWFVCQDNKHRCGKEGKRENISPSL